MFTAKKTRQKRMIFGDFRRFSVLIWAIMEVVGAGPEVAKYSNLKHPNSHRIDLKIEKKTTDDTKSVI